MADELTTAMHEEFIGDEIPHLDLQVMGVFGAIRRGLTKQQALEKYELTEEVYDANIERVLKS
ncbi:MAG: hypothetical protein K5856_08455 [Bacteroidaceae bacterium]|nr:hypothetical protein [Bacteroidaceae bacterium]